MNEQSDIGEFAPQDQPGQDTEPLRVVTQPEPEKTLYSWQAPARLFKKRNKESYSTLAALILLLSIILLFAKEFLLIAVILSFGFVWYALAMVEPESIEHILTNKGVRSHNKLYRFQAISRYWWEEKWGQQLLHIETPDQFPNKLLLLLGKGDKDRIEDIIGKYVIMDKPEPTWVDNAAKWLQEKVPLESQDGPISKSS